MERTIFWSCAILTLLLESLCPPTAVLLPPMPSTETMTRKSGLALSRNLPSSTLISALPSDGPRTVSPTAPRDPTTAPPVPRTRSDVPSPMPCTVPASTLDLRSPEPMERSCLDSRNTRLDPASELTPVISSKCPGTSFSVSARSSRSIARSTPSPSLRVTGTAPVCTPTFLPSPCASPVDSLRSRRPSTSWAPSTRSTLPFMERVTNCVLPESSRLPALINFRSELLTVVPV
mmetsp:Transcript_18336/g.31532  ORF Transcript_18336/g.31532 Transcript_18336/m.31532 type:complete len:233 (+) Transcript_18336:449-1147(+)